MKGVRRNPSSSSEISPSFVANANAVLKNLERVLEIGSSENVFKTQSIQTESLPENVDTLEQTEETILPPLIYQFGMPQDDNVYRVWEKGTLSGHVSMSMRKNGKVELLKNEEGCERTPALVGFTDRNGLVYGTEAAKIILPPKRNGLPPKPTKVWQCLNLKRSISVQQQQLHSIDLNDLGLVNLPVIFFVAYLIRKLKITAESQCDGGSCHVAIMAVPMLTKCAQRLRLKEAALIAGFHDVYLITAEGLAAYYWFHEKQTEMEQNNYSKEFVIIDLFEHAVVYQKSLESGKDRKKILVVKAILLLDNSCYTQTVKFLKMYKKKLKISDNHSMIPVIGADGDSLRACYLGSNYQTKIVKDAEVNYFPAKGAALLSETPENLGPRVQNMIGTTITIEPGKEVTPPNQILPELFVRWTFNMNHDRTKYRVTQTGNGRRRQETETIGHLIVSGVKRETELQVTYELSWEGIWKVVGVSAKHPSEDDEEYKAVKWDWLIGDKVDSYGSSYQECASLLLKILPATGQRNVTSTGLTSDDNFGGLLNTQEEAVVAPACSSSATSSADRNEIQKRKRTKQSTVIRPNDMIVNTGLKKIKLESDWVEPMMVKTEQDAMEGSEEHKEIEVDEGRAKVEVGKTIYYGTKREWRRNILENKKVLRNRKLQ